MAIRPSRQSAKQIKYAPLFCFLIGLIFIAVGVGMGFRAFNHDDGRVYTTAVITKTYPDHIYYDEDTTYTAYVTYEVNGQEVTSRLDSQSSSHRRGKSVEIYYYPDDLSVAHSKHTPMLFAIIFPCFGVAVIVMGVTTFCSLRARKKAQANSASTSYDINTDDATNYGNDYNANNYGVNNNYNSNNFGNNTSTPNVGNGGDTPNFGNGFDTTNNDPFDVDFGNTFDSNLADEDTNTMDYPFVD